jgi:hypothetical protein
MPPAEPPRPSIVRQLPRLAGRTLQALHLGGLDMTKRRSGLLAAILAAGTWSLMSCSDSTDPPPPPPVKPVCSDSVTITVTVGTDSVPVFSWTPDCKLGRLLVEQGFDEYWGTETCGENTYESPIRYSINPPNTCPEEPAIPLIPGQAYRVSVFRFVTVNPESLQILGRRDFNF